MSQESTNQEPPAKEEAEERLPSRGLFAVGDVVVADEPIAGYDRNWMPETFCVKGDRLLVIKVCPNEWYHVAHKDDPLRTFRIRHREISPANDEL